MENRKTKRCALWWKGSRLSLTISPSVGRAESTYDTKIENIYKLYLRIYKNNMQSGIIIYIILHRRRV